MNRKHKLILNTISSLLLQLSTIASVFLLSRYFLLYYGSEVNGLIASITKFLGLITIFDAGVGVVVESILYKPIAENDNKIVDIIMTAFQRFYYRIVLIIIIYTIILAVLYPLKILSFPYLYTFTLIVSIAISAIGQYCFGVTNAVLLAAYQKSYIDFLINIFTIVINTIVSIVLITHGFSIPIVKLFSSIIFLIRPVFLAIFVRIKYKINWNAKYTEDPITNKWNGFSQHIAAQVNSNTDIILLTIFSTLKSVSIYSVYFLVINGINAIIQASSSGIRPLLGDMLARDKRVSLIKTFNAIEIFYHAEIVIMYISTVRLIIPFIKLYTSGINDVNYEQPAFAILLCITYAIYNIRIPYFSIIKVAGHFKETEISAIIEVFLNILISITLLLKYNNNLCSVLVGTLIAMSYRTIYFILYLKNNILYRPIIFSFMLICLDIVMIFISTVVINMPEYQLYTSYYNWCILSMKITFLSFIICFFPYYAYWKLTDKLSR